ncbi:DUF4258 domain-containing protein [bacterium]|nr:DUF4258 domain-containing protein [bacterium]MBU1652375.1 DUF4258 domain-containing protein [bacterium]MBU1880405.1 DUF4258 domain-containing protein [bacterium]
MDLKGIRQQVALGQIFYTRHAVQRMYQRGISTEMVESAILKGEIIEEYPDDKYGPSCLIAAELPAEWLHVVISLGTPPWVITTYVPDPKEWINFTRRSK